MAFTRAVILVRNDTHSDSATLPAFFQDVLFKPLLRWLSDALFSAGGRSVCVIRESAEWDSLILPCFPTLLCDLLVLDTSSPHVETDVKSYLSDGGGEALFVTAPALAAARAIDSLCLAHTTGGHRVTELLTDDEHPSGAYCFSTQDTETVFSQLDTSFDFKAACRNLRADGHSIGSYFVSDGSGGVARVRDPMELHMARRAVQTSVLERHMSQGVAILDPSSTIVSSDAVIGRNTTLLPGVIIRGESVVGEDCQIGPFALLSNCTVGDRSSINASQIYDSSIGADSTVGPYAHIRPGCSVGDRVRVGSFVELKNACIGDDTRIPHLAYVGDADVGERVNFGCGAITANFDGRTKHRTVIEEEAFIGCNTNLVAPVRVCRQGYTAAGSTITKEVPSGALGIARAKQVNLAGWTEKRRRQTADK